MKNLKIIKMVIVLLVAIVMMTISTQVLATGELVDPTQNAPLQINILSNEVQTPDTNVVAPITNAEQNQNTLPQTGDASDYAIFLMIALCIVVSIYAYKKVRDYNRI